MSLSNRPPDGIFDPYGKYPNPLTGQPYTKQYFKHSIGTPDKPGWSTFTSWEYRMEILRKIHNYSILLLKL